MESCKVCIICKLEKPLDDFEDIRRGRYKRNDCHSCRCQHRVRWHKANTKTGRSILGYLINKYEGLPCMDCGGVFDWCAMDYDHRPDEVKQFRIGARGSLLATSERIKQVEEEIARCDLICACCHRMRTKERSNG
jgi:hypothetical protein